MGVSEHTCSGGARFEAFCEGERQVVGEGLEKWPCWECRWAGTGLMKHRFRRVILVYQYREVVRDTGEKEGFQ